MNGANASYVNVIFAAMSCTCASMESFQYGKFSYLDR